VGNKLTKQQRRELAKRERLEAQKRARRRKNKTRVYGTGTTVVVIVIIAVLIALLAGKKSVTLAKVNLAAAAAGCSPVQTFPFVSRTHVPVGTTVTDYNSNPPTQGNHWSQTGLAPGPTGVHAAPVPNEVQVHNLEHGNIVIQYSPSLSPDVRNALEDFTHKFDTRVMMAPRDPKYNTPGTVWLTSWLHMIACNASPTSPTSAVNMAEAFRKYAAGKFGPEGDIPGTPSST
jgi:uncharacterized protein DUF3105